MSFLSTQAYKGARDFYPAEKSLQQALFARLRQVVQGFGFEEYDGPMLEPFELYAAKTGEEIVNQQLYAFTDRGERKVAIRPEMTPTLARMVAGRIQELPKPVRWFSIPNLWRYERPQRGRLREHWQLNVDILGGDPILADAEILVLALKIFEAFGAGEKISIQVNNRRLMDQLFLKDLQLTEAQAQGLSKALDARAKLAPEAFEKWLNDLGLSAEAKIRLDAFLKADLATVQKNHPGPGAEELDRLLELLKARGLADRVSFNPGILRGMDYYTGTVFEAYDVSPENRRALFGGGRYDNLMGLFTKQKLSGVGFGLGDVTLKDFLETHKLLPQPAPAVDVLVSLPKLELWSQAESLADSLRAQGLRVMTPLAADGFGAQLKLASKHGARFVILLGEDELSRGQVAVKDLSTGQQESVNLADVALRLHSMCKTPK